MDRRAPPLSAGATARPGLARHVEADASGEDARVREVMDRASAAGVAEIARVTGPAREP